MRDHRSRKSQDVTCQALRYHSVRLSRHRLALAGVGPANILSISDRAPGGRESNLLAAGGFYLLFVAALVYFVVYPALRIGSIKQALLRGALFGLVTYATYDLTNLATLREWPLLVTAVNMLWGMILTAATAAVSVWMGKKL